MQGYRVLRPGVEREEEGLKVEEMKISESNMLSWKVPSILPLPCPMYPHPQPLTHKASPVL